MRKLGSEEANSVIENIKSLELGLKLYVGDLTKKDFKLYKSLTRDLHKDSRISLAINFFTMARRLILLYVAMFLEHLAWL